MNYLFRRYGGSVITKAIIVLLLGLLALLWPIVMISLYIVCLGAFILVDGILSLIAALRKRKSEAHWDWLFLNGVFGIFAGVLTFFNPFILIAAAAFMFIGDK